MAKTTARITMIGFIIDSSFLFFLNPAPQEDQIVHCLIVRGADRKMLVEDEILPQQPTIFRYTAKANNKTTDPHIGRSA